MKRHITASIVGVTAVVLVVLGIPLAVVVRSSIIRSEVLRLQRDAMRTVAEVEVPIDTADLAQVAAEEDSLPAFGVYDESGERVFGVGPERADAVTQQALTGGSASKASRHPVVAAALVGDHEVVVGAVRIGGSSRSINRRMVAAFAIMAGAVFVALLMAWLIARRLAARLARPLVALTAVGEGLARGETWVPSEPSGVAEIDELADALQHGASRIVEALARERRFSEDVSHQLRTPITSLRLLLETEPETVRDDGRRALAREELGRLEATVTDLLRSARGTMPTADVTALDPILDAIERRWSGRFTAERRSLQFSGVRGARAIASPSLLEQVLDVLLHNALRHGTGAVSCTVRSMAGGIAVSVADEGGLDPSLTDEVLFRRGTGADHGIGLALARDLVEADGGRLVVGSRAPTTFTAVLLGAD